MNQFTSPTPASQPAPPAYPAYPAYPVYPASPVPPAYPPYGSAPPAAPVYPAYPGHPGYPPYPAPAFRVRQRDPRKARARFTLNRTAAIVLLQVAASVALQLLVLQIFQAVGVDAFDSLSLVLLSGALAPVCTAGPALAYMFAFKGSWGDSLLFDRVGFFPSLLWVLAGLGLCIAGNYPANIIRILLESLGADASASITGQGDSWLCFGAELFVVAMLVPVVEEFAFRGVIFSALRPYGQGFAIVGSALIFGMAHLDISSVVFATIAGIGMALAYAKTRSLWVTVCIHAANNGLAVLGSYVGSDLLPFSHFMAELFQLLLTLVPLVLGAIAFVILLALGHRRKQKAPAGPQLQPPAMPPLRGGEAAACILSTPLMWAVFVLVLLETAILFL